MAEHYKIVIKVSYDGAIPTQQSLIENSLDSAVTAAVGRGLLEGPGGDMIVETWDVEVNRDVQEE